MSPPAATSADLGGDGHQSVSQREARGNGNWRADGENGAFAVVSPDADETRPECADSPFPPIVVLVGPTAVGKSAMALELATEFGMDIISADSRQVYRYLDIGTAKPTRPEQAAVPHHMIDLVEPSETYTAGRYRDEGERILNRLGAEGRPALIVGGTGFYIRALLDVQSYPEVPPNATLRDELAAIAAERGTAALHARLVRVDPASAARIHRNNVNRVIRALEIVTAIGEPVPPLRGTTRPALFLGLTMERGALRRQADARVLSQVRAGLPEETRLAIAMGYSPDLPALQGFGYRQMVAYVQGKMSLPDAIEGYANAQHRFIRRQMTWFNADARIHWIDQGPNALDSIRQQVRAYLAR